MFPASVTWTGLKILRKEKCEFIPKRVIISHNESKHKYITSMWPFSICPFCAALCFKWELRKLKASKGIHRDFFFFFLVLWNPSKSWQLFPVMLPNFSQADTVTPNVFLIWLVMSSGLQSICVPVIIPASCQQSIKQMNFSLGLYVSPSCYNTKK